MSAINEIQCLETRDRNEELKLTCDITDVCTLTCLDLQTYIFHVLLFSMAIKLSEFHVLAPHNQVVGMCAVCGEGTVSETLSPASGQQDDIAQCSLFQ